MATGKKSKTLKKQKKLGLKHVWIGVFIVLIVAVIGLVVIRFSQAGVEIYKINDTDKAINCPPSNIINEEIQVSGFKPVRQQVCRVDKAEVNITLPRSVRPNEKVCFWGKSGSWRNDAKLSGSRNTETVFGITSSSPAKSTVGILSCFINYSGSNRPIMTLRSTSPIDLTNVSYGY